MVWVWKREGPDPEGSGRCLGSDVPASSNLVVDCFEFRISELFVDVDQLGGNVDHGLLFSDLAVFLFGSGNEPALVVAAADRVDLEAQHEGSSRVDASGHHRGG